MAQCVFVKKNGDQCQRPAMKGATVCSTPAHGATRRVKAYAGVRAEVEMWKLGDQVDDPGTVLLRLITQSRRRADLYAELLEDAYKRALEGKDPELKMPDGVRVLVGHRYAVGPEGQKVAVSEEIRGLVVLEAQERDRLANFCIKAITAGLAERVVRMQEQEAALAHRALMAGLDAAGITGEARTKVLNGTAAHLRLIAG